MTLFLFLTVIQAIIAATLVILVLMQRSEGGGLGIGGGGGPGGLMSARGAADFLTRATKWSAVLFVGLSIVLAALAVDVTGTREFDDTLDRSTTAPAGQSDPLFPADQGLDGEPPVDPAAEAAQENAEDPLSGVAD
ncbi:preprotein translocase subunit SecG [Aurantiacibacter spongiae]|uniref:Protein-export membrane protein SecG n=1 Tax=Aurantiacibacter spongiae TaxID=2488860 RepID=A0A3N5CUP9_9SPHN|nr:preprotein translocase subunit SecG [Aurantiacibacter spongiae]RPF70349.1 preprotein translocase subunit SecG [Aurantiacibacter spongiae]